MDKDGLYIETVFSSITIKRMFDSEYVYSTVRLKNMIQQEMMLKASWLYNKMISI